MDQNCHFSLLVINNPVLFLKIRKKKLEEIGLKFEFLVNWKESSERRGLGQ